MKVTCDSLLEAPLINMIKLYDSLNVKGVCGILTPSSKHNVEHTTISALGLLSYCNELLVAEHFTDKLKLIDVTLNKGPINYYEIANSSSGVLISPEGISSEPFAMATNPVRFRLLVGSTETANLLTEEDIYTFVSENNAKGYEFTGVPMPLLSKNLVQCKSTVADGISTIDCQGVPDNTLELLFSSLKVE